LKASSVDILGEYSSLPNKTGSLRVHPYVGFIRGVEKEQDLLNRFNTDEVSNVFTLPIEYLVDPRIREIKQFRDSKQKYTVFKVPDHIEGEKEIWGLTSFILDGKYIDYALCLYGIDNIIFFFRRLSQDYSRALFLDLEKEFTLINRINYTIGQEKCCFNRL
jgi:hypothetical protein